MPLLLTNEDVEQVLTMDMCLEAMGNAFRDLGEGKAVDRPRSHTYTQLAEDKFYLFKSMDGALPEYGVHALRFTSDILHEPVVGGNRRREKLPALPGNKWLGLVLLFRIENGELLAIIQDGYLQRMRVGATSALAAKYLSRPDSRVAGMFGTGWQAGAQLEALVKVRPVEKVRVYSPNPDHRRVFAAEMSKKLGVTILAVDNPQDVVRGADIVVAATNSLVPVFDGHWLEPRMHVNSIQGREVDQVTLDRADVIVVRSGNQPTHWVLGTRLPGEVEKGKQFSEQHKGKLCDLGELVSGKAPGRTAEQQITLFGGGGTGGSAGMGIQFAAVGAVIYQAARERGLGRELPLEWFVESVHP